MFVFFSVSISLRVVGISVPSLKQRGESVTLTCDYDLEGGKLYSVKWYRDNEEFYRYMPRLRPPQHAHKLDGVKVDLEKSSARRVHLRELTLKSRGIYRCEVSEEAPSFHSAQAETFMEIYYFPRENPRIVGHERPYFPHEPLDVNCSSAKAFPPPELQWHINGQKVTETSWLTNFEAKTASQGLMVSTLGLRAPAKPLMKIRCIATIGNHRREKTVSIVTNSADRRKASNFNLTLVIIICIFKVINLEMIS
ncbi:jg26173 [Pararge aegeria aegeria]|uniref:Jg26173 protein n=1 Tax=Pararge aegeria aegeria TaxID=348720 RepID=A0A8S4SN56_9NEOP|nr:jg26173 [Pararge aegeria aegeria]